MSVLGVTSHLRGEAQLRELVRLLAQDLGHRLNLDIGLGRPPHNGVYTASAMLVREAVDALDAIDIRAAHPLAIEFGPGEQGSRSAHCFLWVPSAYATGQWELLAAPEWCNPALGLAWATHKLNGARLLRGAFAVQPTIEGRVATAGYFDKWRSSQLEAGAVKWRNGVRTARLEGHVIAEDQQELDLSPADESRLGGEATFGAEPERLTGGGGAAL